MSLSEQYEFIKEFKIKTSARDLCQGKPSIIYPFLDYAYKLKFDEIPDYQKLRFMVKLVLIEQGFVPDNIFDWNLKGGITYKKFDEASDISSCGCSSGDVTENI